MVEKSRYNVEEKNKKENIAYSCSFATARVGFTRMRLVLCLQVTPKYYSTP